MPDFMILPPLSLEETCFLREVLFYKVCMS